MIIFQKPNPPLMAAGGGFVVSLLTHGPFHRLGNLFFYVFILIWSYQEMTSGVNWFRKLFGLIILIAVAFGLYQQLR